MIIAWGSGKINANKDSSGSIGVNLPISFTSIYSVVMNGNTSYKCYFVGDGFTTTNISLKTWNLSNSNHQNLSAYYIACGY